MVTVMLEMRDQRVHIMKISNGKKHMYEDAISMHFCQSQTSKCTFISLHWKKSLSGLIGILIESIIILEIIRILINVIRIFYFQSEIYLNVY